MGKHFHSELRNRPDLAVIAELVDPGHRVLDLGCGDGSFLKILYDNNPVKFVSGANAAEEAFAAMMFR